MTTIAQQQSALGLDFGAPNSGPTHPAHPAHFVHPNPGPVPPLRHPRSLSSPVTTAAAFPSPPFPASPPSPTLLDPSGSPRVSVRALATDYEERDRALEAEEAREREHNHAPCATPARLRSPSMSSASSQVGHSPYMTALRDSPRVQLDASPRNDESPTSPYGRKRFARSEALIGKFVESVVDLSHIEPQSRKTSTRERPLRRRARRPRPRRPPPTSSSRTRCSLPPSARRTRARSTSPRSAARRRSRR
jgi:hypothetical protein